MSSWISRNIMINFIAVFLFPSLHLESKGRFNYFEIIRIVKYYANHRCLMWFKHTFRWIKQIKICRSNFKLLVLNKFTKSYWRPSPTPQIDATLLLIITQRNWHVQKKWATFHYRAIILTCIWLLDDWYHFASV